MVITASTGILKQKLAQAIKDHPEYIHTPQALVSKLAFTKDETTYANDLTLKQWRCKECIFQSGTAQTPQGTAYC